MSPSPTPPPTPPPEPSCPLVQHVPIHFSHLDGRRKAFFPPLPRAAHASRVPPTVASLPLVTVAFGRFLGLNGRRFSCRARERSWVPTSPHVPTRLENSLPAFQRHPPPPAAVNEPNAPCFLLQDPTLRIKSTPLLVGSQASSLLRPRKHRTRSTGRSEQGRST
ncbi:hypothetical protein VPH35_017169 [Triticum aestivum]